MSAKLGWTIAMALSSVLIAGPAVANYTYPTQNTAAGTKRLGDITLANSSRTYAGGKMFSGCNNFSGRLRKNNNISPDSTVSSFSGTGCNNFRFDNSDNSVSAFETYHGDFTYASSGRSFSEQIIQN